MICHLKADLKSQNNRLPVAKMIKKKKKRQLLKHIFQCWSKDYELIDRREPKDREEKLEC